MKHTNAEMLSPNDIPFVPSDSLAENIKTIQSYSSLEEDEDFLPVAQREIQRAVSALEAIYKTAKLLPFFIVPTRSGGVGLEYKVKDTKANYRFDPDGLMYFTVMKDVTVLKRAMLTNPAEAPALIEAI
jgi:hypothetical protein